MSTPASTLSNPGISLHDVRTAIHAHWRGFLVTGIAMVILGILAATLPNISSLAIEILVGWLFFVGGLVRAATVMRGRQLPGYWWSVLGGVCAMAFGALLIARPLQGVVTLALVMTAVFAVEGVTAIFIGLDFRHHVKNWLWTVSGGVINLVLAYLIWAQWPSSATWIIGLYVGVNMILIGIPLIATAIAARTLRGALD
jgi:uncharacterized membrane protein HdeD (DUF308 family)